MEGSSSAAPAGGSASPAGSGGSAPSGTASVPAGSGASQSGVPAVPAGSQAKGTRPVPASSGARGNDGRFLPKDGNVANSPAPSESSEEPPPPPKEPYRFKAKLKVDGEEEEVDFDEPELQRRLQRYRAMEKRQRAFVEAGERGERILGLLKQDPAEAFRAAGVDPVEWIQHQLQQHIEYSKLSDEQREAVRLQQENEQYKARLQAYEQRQAEVAKQQKMMQLKGATEKRYTEALTRSGLPMTPQVLYLMAEVEKEAWNHADRHQLPRPDLSTDELAAGARERIESLVDGYLGALEGPQLLKALGPQRVKSLLRAAVAEAQAKRGVPSAAPPVDEEPAGESPFLTEAQVKENLRQIRQGKL